MMAIKHTTIIELERITIPKPLLDKIKFKKIIIKIKYLSYEVREEHSLGESFQSVFVIIHVFLRLLLSKEKKGFTSGVI